MAGGSGESWTISPTDKGGTTVLYTMMELILPFEFWFLPSALLTDDLLLFCLGRLPRSVLIPAAQGLTPNSCPNLHIQLFSHLRAPEYSFFSNFLFLLNPGCCQVCFFSLDLVLKLTPFLLNRFQKLIRKCSVHLRSFNWWFLCSASCRYFNHPVWVGPKFCWNYGQSLFPLLSPFSHLLIQ